MAQKPEPLHSNITAKCTPAGQLGNQRVKNISQLFICPHYSARGISPGALSEERDEGTLHLVLDTELKESWTVRM